MDERHRPAPLSYRTLRRVLNEENRRETAAFDSLAGEMDAIAAREPECKRRRDEAAVLPASNIPAR